MPLWVNASARQKWKVLIDYRKLNKMIIGGRYPFPNMPCGKYFFTLYLASGFHQIGMNEKNVADITSSMFAISIQIEMHTMTF